MRAIMLIGMMIIVMTAGVVSAQDTWMKTYGGIAAEHAEAMEKVPDGGYMVAGWTETYGAGNDDWMLMRLDEAGNMIWAKTYGGPERERAYAMKRTSDGNYVVAGETRSLGAGLIDAWVMKVDGNGAILWQKTIGASNVDWASALAASADGGVVVAGWYQSGISGTKLSSNGIIEWSEWFPDVSGNNAVAVVDTADGGFIFGGIYAQNPYGLALIKVNSGGTVVWEKLYPTIDDFPSIARAGDGGFFVAAASSSYGNGLSDVVVMKIDSAGAIQWQRRYDASDEEYVWDVAATPDGGCAVAAERYLMMGNFWLLKLDSEGYLQWQKTYGWDYIDQAFSLLALSDGKFAAAGRSRSLGSGSDDFWVMKTYWKGDISICDYVFEKSVQTGAVTIVATDVTINPATVNWTVSDTAVTGIDAPAVMKSYCPLPYEPNIQANPATVLFAETMLNNIATALITVHNEGAADLHISEVSGPAAPFYVQFNTCSGATVEKDSSCLIQVQFSPAVVGSYSGTLHINSDDPDQPAVSISLSGKGVDAGYAYWIRTYTTDLLATIMDAEPVTNGYVIAGAVYPVSGYRDGWVAKLDLNGNLEWQKKYGGPYSDYLDFILPSDDGGYIAAGITEPTSSTGSIWVLKLDSSGSILWQKSYSDPQYSYSYPYAIIKATEGGYMVVSLGNRVFRIDENGAIQWARTYATGDSFNLNEIHEASGGGYVLTGIKENSVLVLKIDDTGTVIWAKTYGGSEWDEAESLEVTPEGDIIIAGVTSSFSMGAFSMMVLKLNPDGNIIWQKVYAGDNYGEYARKIALTSDGGYMITGETYSPSTMAEDLFLTKINQDGDVVWLSLYHLGMDNTIQSLSADLHGGFIIAGKFDAGSVWNYAVMKIPEGSTASGCDYSEDYLLTDYVPLFQAIDQTAASAPVTITSADTTITPADSSIDESLVCSTGYVVLQPYQSKKPVVDDSNCTYPNGIIEPEEEVILTGHLENTGTQPALNTTGLLLTTDPVTITQPYGYYGAILPGTDLTCSTCYSLLAPATNRPATHWDADVIELSMADNYASVPFTYTYHIGNSFSDVSPASMMYLFIETLFHAGITQGCTGTTFCPDQAVQRQQMSKFICASMEATAPGSCTASGCAGIFADVPASNIFCSFIEALYAAGISNGCQSVPLLFCPGNIVRRQEMAKLICLGMEKVQAGSCAPVGCTGIFTDVSQANPFCSYIEALYNHAIIAGCAPSLYCPEGNVSRQQMAKFLVFAFGFTM